MNKLAIVLGLALLVGFASASCPNSCSGHGRCTDHDRCVCYARKDGTVDSEGNVVPAWTGPDCSQRTCPYNKAWFDIPFANNVAHLNAECSNAGVCDRKTGTCQCFPGYEGRACDRTVCHDNCNNRGTCQSIKTFFRDHEDAVNEDAGSHSLVYTQAWDANKIYACKCEAGFRGPTCALKECPSGNDPQQGPDGYGYNWDNTNKVEFRDCSGRGICDYGTGLCQCFKGFFGEDCSLQTTLI